MFKNIKKINEIKRSAKSSYTKEFDKEGREVIRMEVVDDSDFLSPYAHKEGIIISEGVADFLDNSVKPLDLKNDLKIIISSDQIDKKEEEIYPKAIKNYYKSRVIEADRKLKTNTAMSFSMLLVAVFIFIIYIALELKNSGYIILQLVDISAWVFMWEAVDLYFLERRVIKYEQLRACALYSAEIEFLPLTAQWDFAKHDSFTAYVLCKTGILYNNLTQKPPYLSW